MNLSSTTFGGVNEFAQIPFLRVDFWVFLQQDKVKTYVNVPKDKQLEALRFLKQHLWTTQNWLLDISIISEINGDGELIKIQNLQRSALNRLLATKDLNRMLSTHSTLVGVGLSPAEMMHILFEDLIAAPKNLDLSQKTLQLHLAKKLQEMLKDDKLHISLQAETRALLKKINKTAKRKARATGSNKTHFEALVALSHMD